MMLESITGIAKLKRAGIIGPTVRSLINSFFFTRNPFYKPGSQWTGILYNTLRNSFSFIFVYGI